MHVLRTAWLLMQQPQLLDTAHVERPRSEHKHDVREGLSTTPVPVLQLHTEQQAGHAPDGGDSAAREYTYRWLVSGHWRQQRYPARRVHRPVRIAFT